MLCYNNNNKYTDIINKYVILDKRKSNAPFE